MRNFESSISRLFLMDFFSTLVAKPTLEDQIIAAQKHDSGIHEIKKNIASGDATYFSTNDQGTIFFENRLVVHEIQDQRQLILKEAHDTPLSIHPGSTKMYRDLH